MPIPFKEPATEQVASVADLLARLWENLPVTTYYLGDIHRRENYLMDFPLG